MESNAYVNSRVWVRFQSLKGHESQHMEKVGLKRDTQREKTTHTSMQWNILVIWQEHKPEDKYSHPLPNKSKSSSSRTNWSQEQMKNSLLSSENL